MHVLPKGFHRIRYYGFLANAMRAKNIRRARILLNINVVEGTTENSDLVIEVPSSTFVCPVCETSMIVIETFERGHVPRGPPIQRISLCAA